MKTLLANKQTEEQKRSNQYARYQFIMGMMNMDEAMINLLLKKDCKFLGYMNKWQFIHWLKSKFSTLNPHLFHSKYTEGISIDYYPGCDMFEFLYAPLEGDVNTCLSYAEDLDEEAIFNSIKAVSIKLVLLFENGKITDVRIPKKTICKEKTKKFQVEN